ncbi:hypothetical protein IHE55_09135 [Streptomyces pactum]|uniref:Restriction endonuclease type IV Mrr domain-containing protein n=1 Tax=Streptomyces pactum TaxID=68249 RepID=A0ABS0NID8_9ACTN|nr:hypothetical protein [Streptomyces pactum]MBH5334947.1 hypothetical protein [Streptomyces pactum]
MEERTARSHAVPNEVARFAEIFKEIFMACPSEMLSFPADNIGFAPPDGASNLQITRGSADVDIVIDDGEIRIIAECKESLGHAFKRLWQAAWGLRRAKTRAERQLAAAEFLAALAELKVQLLQIIARLLLLLLSRALGRRHSEDAPDWQPEPLDETPQIAPRAPSTALPVITYRGGHRGSALGSAVLAA